MSEQDFTVKPQRREGRGEQRLLANLCGLRASAVNLVFLGLLLAGALLWARGRDPFERRWFKVHPAGAGAAECVAILPKMAAWPLPVVVWLHGSGGSVPGSGDEMRQMAEMGLAVVGLEYEGKAESRKQKAEDGKLTAEQAFDAQFIALLDYLGRQRWADTNRVAWAGYSLGAQRELAFFLRHPERQPKLLVRRAGGWIPELQSEVQSLKSKVQSPSTLNSSPRHNEVTAGQPSTTGKLSTVLLIHGENDQVFTLAEAERVAACLRTNGVPVELRVLPGEGHGGPNGLVVCRMLGEQCLARLNGPDAFRVYRSILSRQARAWPLWLFWTPAFLWAAACVWFRRNRAYPVGTRGKEPQRRDERRGSQPESFLCVHRASAVFRAIGNGCRSVALRLCALTGFPLKNSSLPHNPQAQGRLMAGATRGKEPQRRDERRGSQPESFLCVHRASAVFRAVGIGCGSVALRLCGWIAAILAAAALGQTALHLVPPRLPVGERTLAFARKHLVTPGQRSDFDFLAAQPCWRGQPLQTLLEHVELANYNRELVNWKLDEPMYREFVLSPVLQPSPESKVQGPKSKAEGSERHELHEFTRTPPGLAAGTAALRWRRVLWESFYPRVRREQDPAAAAEIVVRFLRERVTVVGESRKQKVESRNQGPWSVVRGQWSVSSGISGVWQRQISDERGFEALYVAALRSVGVPSRLGSQGRAEFWTGSAWQPAPRPLVERWQ